MKPLFTASTVCSALLLIGSAMPGQAASTSFQDVATTGGDINTTGFGPTAPVTTFSNIVMDTLVITGAPSGNGTYVPLYLFENFNTTTDVLTLTGSIGGCTTPTSCSNLPGLAAITTLASIQLSTGLTANATSGASGSVSVNTPAPASISSITVSPTLLADLGLTGSTFYLSALADTGPQNFVDVNGNYRVTAATLTLTTTDPVPEPASWPVMALISAAGILVLRKRFSRAA